jgi:exodeoxyribonuclease VIII
METIKDAKYFSNPALSQSKLKELKKSPLHLWAKYIDPNRIEEESTEAMILGKATHCALFENELFSTAYCVAPVCDRRTSQGKATYSMFEAMNAGKTILKAEQYTIIQKMVNRIHQKNAVKLLLNGGKAEHELYWADSEFGLDCKAKLDYLIEPCSEYPNGIIIDLKTTTSANANEFSKTIYNLGYYNQVAFYCEAVKQIYKTEDYPMFLFIAAEKTAPFECDFYICDEGTLDAGLQENRKLMKIYKECLTDNKWEGYSDSIKSIGMPHWGFNNITEALDNNK